MAQISRGLITPWTDDPKRKADPIKCTLCNVCHWMNSERAKMCIFGGPYVGFDESRLTPDV